MPLKDFLNIMANRWRTVVVTAVITTLGAVAYIVLQTPVYKATTRLFVSSVGGESVTEIYSGNRLSQERVLSYTQLIMGEALAQRTIDKLNFDMDAATLKDNVTARSKPNTVLIDVAVEDVSPLRARDIANALSDEFVAMARELETANPGDPPNARVVVEQRASVPKTPVAPRKARDSALGLLVGLMLGMGLAVLRDHLDNTVKNSTTLEEITGSGVVGTTPLDKDSRTDQVIRFDTGQSASAEAYRKLRTNLQFLAVDHPPRVIVITSPSPNEGKSTVAANVAIALADGGNEVVLVDGDMRRPTAHHYLDLIGSVGFSNVLSGTVSLSEALQQTMFPHLTALTAGAVPPNPSELLGSQAARRVLAELREQFDFVIVDSSPTLAVTDSALLAASADGALLLARYGKTKREQVTQATESLRSVGAEILGSILTMRPTHKAGSYYQYYGHNVKKSHSMRDDQSASKGGTASETRGRPQ